MVFFSFFLLLFSFPFLENPLPSFSHPLSRCQVCRYDIFYLTMILWYLLYPLPVLSHSPYFIVPFFSYFAFSWSTYGPPSFLLFILLSCLELFACIFFFLFIFGVSYYASMIQCWRHHHHYHQKIGLGIYFSNFFIIILLWQLCAQSRCEIRTNEGIAFKSLSSLPLPSLLAFDILGRRYKLNLNLYSPFQIYLAFFAFFFLILS